MKNCRSVLLLGLFLAAGCGGGPADAPKTAAVKGVVNYKGRPVPKMDVVFNPDGPGMVATGVTDDEGKFSLTSSQPNDGAKPGSYTVSLSPVQEGEIPMPGFPGSEKKAELPIPKKYTNPKTSGLKYTVDSDPAKNDFKIELTD